MYKYISIIICALALSLQTSAQIRNLYTISGNKMVTNSSFFSQYSNHTNPISSNVRVYTYSSENLQVATGSMPKYKISFIGTSPKSVNNGFEGIRIYNESGNLLLERWGYSPLREFKLFKNNGENIVKKFFQISFEDESLVLFFGGITFDSDDDAPEMMIVAIKGNQAKVVFDRPGFVYDYSLYPNFRIDFVETIDWKQNEFGNDETPMAGPLSSCVKHAIWKEGNLLKYNQFK